MNRCVRWLAAALAWAAPLLAQETPRAAPDDLHPPADTLFEARLEQVRFLQASFLLNERRYEARYRVTYVHRGTPAKQEGTLAFATRFHGWSLRPPRHEDLAEGALLLVRLPAGVEQPAIDHVVRVLEAGDRPRPFSPWRLVDPWVALLVVLMSWGMYRWFKSRRYQTIRRLLGYALRYWQLLVGAIVCMVVGTTGHLTPVLVTEPLVDGVLTPPHDLALMERLVVLMLVVAVVSAVSEYYAELCYRTVMQRVIRDVRVAIGAHLVRHSLRYFTKARIGDLMSRLTYDVIVMQAALRFLFGEFLRQPLIVVFGVAAAFVMCWQLALIVFVAFPLLVVPLGRLARKINRESLRGLERLANVTDVMQQMFSGIRTIKAFHMEAFEDGEFRRANEEHYRRAIRVARAKAMSRAMIFFFTGIASAAIVGLGMWLVHAELFGLTSGRLVAFVGVTAVIYKPARALVKAYNELQEALAASDRLFALLDEPWTDTDQPDPRPAPRFADALAFERVSFAYGAEDVLHEVSFRAPKGSTTAFVGRAGVGKSTILDLIARFYLPRAGRVLFDGQDTRGMAHGSLLEQIAVVTQDAFLFHASVRENILFGKPGASAEEVLAAARIANIHEEIAAKPEGYDTVVGERGMNLSGGQRQRVTIARAVIKDAPILLLDEATSSLDSESEQVIQEALHRVMTGRTTFAIAHRLSTILHADQIIVLEEGRVIDIGRHAELLERCALYRTLYEIQFRVHAPPAAERPAPAEGEPAPR